MFSFPRGPVRERENNLAILGETTSLPGLKKKKMMSCLKRHKYVIPKQTVMSINLDRPCSRSVFWVVISRLWPTRSSYLTKRTIYPNVVNKSDRTVVPLLCRGYSGTALHRHDHPLQAIWKGDLLWRREHHVPPKTRHHHPRHAGGCHHLLHRRHRKLYAITFIVLTVRTMGGNWIVSSRKLFSLFSLLP